MHNNDLVNELGQNFIEYAVAVNTDRAIPDATSGLKPVHKRILWSAFEEGRTSSKPHVKAARIVGDVMGKYHPHGDSSIYGAMVRLSQDWVMRYPLIDWHGLNGTINGDGPAASRYTEARLSKLAEDGMLAGIKKKNVDFIPNYSEDAEEPLTLPTIFPNLLCNPNTGIGVAMACNWLPHNLKEVAQAIYDYMDGFEVTLPGPDFPTGGIIINKDVIPEIMRTGHGSVKVRGKYKVEKQNIVFYEIPYGTTIEGLMSEIGEVCDNKEIEGISDVRDETTMKGIRVVIECQKGIDPDAIAKKLFLKTDLQTSISYNQVALINKTPTELNLKQCIEIYVKHNIECLKKEILFDVNKAKDRLHIVEGLLIALEDIDNVIQLIKKSDSAAAAKDNLIKKYNLTEIQAKAILDMKLSKLAKLEKVELENEKKELMSTIEQLAKILAKEELQKIEIKKRLENIVKKYGDNRRTELIQIDTPKEEKEIEAVIPEDVVVVLSQGGEIKRIAKSSFRVQRKGGKGVKTAEDAILATISTNTIDNLMLFSNKGKMYKLLVDKIPVGTNVSKGQGIGSLIQKDMDERIVAAASLDRDSDADYVVFITKKGLFKKTEMSEYKSIKKSTGTQAIKLKDEDSIANVIFMKEEEFLVITKKGMTIRFETKDIGAIGRVTSGVKSIKLAEDDEVIYGCPIKNENDCLAIINKNGYGKRCKLDEFPIQGRGGKGLKTIEDISGAVLVGTDDNILLIGKPSSICIPAAEMPIQGRTTTGSKLSQSEVKSVVKL